MESIRNLGHNAATNYYYYYLLFVREEDLDGYLNHNNPNINNIRIKRKTKPFCMRSNKCVLLCIQRYICNLKFVFKFSSFFRYYRSPGFKIRRFLNEMIIFHFSAFYLVSTSGIKFNKANKSAIVHMDRSCNFERRNRIAQVRNQSFQSLDTKKRKRNSLSAEIVQIKTIFLLSSRIIDKLFIYRFYL